ncbi:deoxyribonuclease IV [uncultured Duncaniella sp.]|jgi:deoxyribonuclease-4|uniref:deoxyribonuclease IV n=1 Tax=uncultured Duncaniella sp. TaxID=2768039 RepID=UPI002676738F|nr:deoxyribonuclease IV [uncultured Duncaniella sp.]MCI9172028.1 deoxyribonuclease IV [Muribaculaceae bacterium]
MKLIGAHVSVDKGVSNAPLNARAIGAKAFALFTRNPSRWVSKAISDAEADKFKRNCEECGFTPDMILPHDSYLINLGSPDEEKLQKSREAFLDEMNRCSQLGLTMLNFHPGSHMREMSEESCLDRIAESLNMILDTTSGVKAVIENTAGQGSNLGYSFHQLAHIIDRIEDKTRVGVCIDTCHAHSAGYDMTTPEAYRRTWEEFDQVVGFKYLCGMHINDTAKALGSRVDRHAPIGQGILGEEFWRMLMTDPRMDGIPLILETTDVTLWPEEIRYLYSLTGEC